MVAEQRLLTATRSNERELVIDVWRSFALVLVCIVNFMQANQDSLTPARADTLATAAIDWRVASLVGLLFTNKAHTIFAFMFGLGLAMIAQRAGPNALRIVSRRLLVLLAFGWVHYVVLYHGDILHTYAALGLIMFLLLRHLNHTVLLVLGLGLALLGRLVFEERSFFWDTSVSAAAISDAVDVRFSPDWMYHRKEIGTLAEVIGVNIARVLQEQSELSRNLAIGGYYLGRIALGYLFWTSGCAAALLNLQSSKLLRLSLSLVAASVALVVATYVMRVGNPGSVDHLLFNGARQLSFLVLAGTYLVVLAYLCRQPKTRQLSAAFAPLGRMSLTNYVLQSVGMFVIFYGVGLRLGGDVGTAVAVLLAIVFSVIQLVATLLWFRYFDQGPLEWCWRRVVYAT